MTAWVLLPGMDGTGALFAPFIDALRGQVPVSTVSYPRAGPQDYPRLQALAAAALPAQGRCLLLGESFSGPIAVSLAAANPDRVAGVILCCTFARNPRPRLGWLGALAAATPAPLPPLAVLSHFLLGRFATPPLRAMLRNALAEVPAAALRARLGAVLGVDVAAQARRLRVPVLYLRAAHDRLVPEAVSMEAVALCPGAMLETLDAPHCLLQAAPEAAARTVLAWLRNQGG